MRVFGFLKDESIDRKQRVRENSRQDDVRHERQDYRNSQDCDDSESNPEEDAFLFQWSLPYAARAPKTAWTYRFVSVNPMSETKNSPSLLGHLSFHRRTLSGPPL